MADVVDLIHINDITVICTLGPEDDHDWKDTRLLARVLFDDELSDEFKSEHLPVIHEGEKAVAVWEFGNFQVPSNRLPLTLAITTTSSYKIFRFKFQRLNGKWSFEEFSAEEMHRNARAQAILYHPSSNFHMRYLATPDTVLFTEIPNLEPGDASEDSCRHWLAENLPAELLLGTGKHHYDHFRCGEKGHLKHALTAFEKALESPNIAPGLFQVLETIIPFLHCLEQGYGSCPDVAFQVLQMFRGVPGAQLDAQLLLLEVVHDVACSLQWLDYFRLAVKLITGPLEVLLRSAPSELLPLNVLRNWVNLAPGLAPEAKEVLPLIDLAVDFLPDLYPTSEGLQSFAVLRAIVYLQQAILPGGPSLDVTLKAAESAMQSLSRLETSGSPISGLWGVAELNDFSTTWFCFLCKYSVEVDLEPYKDRLISFITWQLSNLPISPERQNILRGIQLSLTNNGPDRDPWHLVKLYMPRARAILDDNDNQFIMVSYLNLMLDDIGETGMPAQYPHGAAEMTRAFITDEGSRPLAYAIAAATARALNLPEALQLYERFMASLEPFDWSLGTLCAHQLRGIRGSFVASRDAISYASEMDNHALALQWNDQCSSKIWDWYFHSRMSIDRGHAREPVIARKLRQRPRWIDRVSAPDWGTVVEPTDDRREIEEFCMVMDRFNSLPPGLERFLRPKTPAEITSIAEALGGPIIYLNPSRYSSHALAVLPGLDDVVHVPLPDLHYPGLRDLSANFMKSPQTFLWEGISVERKGHMVKPEQIKQPAEQRFPAKSLLRQLWVGVVKPVLDGLAIQCAQTRTENMPRIWWCPSGPLIGLPIHAAGIYEDDGQGPVISDYVVSSYFPSASALAYATRPADPSQKFSLLTIANPTGAGLPGTELELEKIEKHTATLPTQELTRGEAAVEKVKKGMENASWVHFACHGAANPDKPWESALILADHTRLTLREISDMSLPHAEFAFLSACQTAKGMDDAPDQSAHLSTGMMACGYRGVIGTMHGKSKMNMRPLLRIGSTRRCWRVVSQIINVLRMLCMTRFRLCVRNTRSLLRRGCRLSMLVFEQLPTGRCEL